MNRRGSVFAVTTALTLAFAGLALAQYRAPNTDAKLFGGDIAMGQDERGKLATLLAKAVKNDVPLLTRNDFDNAAKLLAVALQLDPSNRSAVVVNGNLSAGRKLDKDATWSHDEFMKELRKAAAAEKASKNKPDKQCAAYLYAALNIVSPNDDDTYEVEMLKKAGIAATWTDAAADKTVVIDPKTLERIRPGTPAPTANVSTKAARVSTRVKGLVVSMAPDGRYTGKVVEIIGTSPPDSRGGHPQIITPVGPQMMTAFNECLRLIEVRKPAALGMRLDVSFDDKYSAKDGGSAGTAFTLLCLSAAGEFEISPETAVTGDILVDGRVAPVGGIAAKVRGATLDGCKAVSIPKVNSNQIGDLYLLYGVQALWDIQILSADTIDDAIANLRTDRPQKLADAMKLFDELRTQMKSKPGVTGTIGAGGSIAPAALTTAPAKDKLAKVLELAPNHLSAEWLQMIAQNKAPTKLSLGASITEALAAIGPMRLAFQGEADPGYGNPKANEEAHRNLAKVRAKSEVTLVPFIISLDEYVTAYTQWGIAESTPTLTLQAQQAKIAASQNLINKRSAVKAAYEKVISDKTNIENMMRQ